MKKLDYLIIVFLAAVFLFSAADKIIHYPGFVNALSSYVLVPRGWSQAFAPSLIALELAAGAGLLIPGWRRPATLLSGLLLVLFTFALTFNYIFGIRNICGCWFTLTLAEGQATHIGFNLLLAGLAFMQLFEQRRPSFIESQRA